MGPPFARLTWLELRKLTDMHNVYNKHLALTGNAERISGVDLLCQENGVSDDMNVWPMQTGHVILC